MNRLKAIGYKEWHKTKLALTLGLLILSVLLIHNAITLHTAIRFSGADALWEAVILKSYVPIERLRYLPIIIAVAVGVAQFFPEYQSKRLKLTLHLPVNETLHYTTILLYGVVALSVLVLIPYLLYLLFASQYFPREVISFWSHSVWVPYLASITAYLLTAWVIIEPTMWKRICNLLISVAMVGVFYHLKSSAQYMESYALLVLLLMLAFVFNFNSLTNFKNGGDF